MRPINLLERFKSGNNHSAMMCWPFRSNHVIVVRVGHTWRVIPLVSIRAAGGK